MDASGIRPARGALLAQALLAAGLLLATVAIRIPFEIFAASSREFSIASGGVFLTLLAFALLLFALVALALRWLPIGLLRLLAPAMTVLAVYGWCRAGFFPGPALQLAGGPIDDVGGTGWPGLVVPVLAGLALAGLALARFRIHAVVMACLLLGALAQSAINAAAVWETRRKPPVEALGAMLEFSRRGNVLVLVFDTMQSDLAAEVLEKSPDLRGKLAGFTHYRFATSEAPSTYMSMPMLHGGRYYDPGMSVPDFIAEATGKQSFLNRFADAGYATSHAYVVLPCPEKVVHCLHNFRLNPAEVDRAPMVAAQLFDIGLYRVLPDRGRKIALRRNLDLVTLLVGHSLQSYQIIDGAAALSRLASSMTVSDGPPTAKLVHTVVSHPPYVLRRDCTVGERQRGREAALEQVECSLRRLAGILDRLGQEGIAGVTSVVVVADHGTTQVDSAWAAEGSSAEFKRLLASHNPVFMVRPAGQRAPLATSDLPVKLTDLAGALCGPSGCRPVEGLQGLAGLDPARSRLVFDYTWHHRYWNSPYLPNLGVFEIRGDATRQENWIRRGTDAVPGSTRAAPVPAGPRHEVPGTGPH